MREIRRGEIIQAYVRVLSEYGQHGATIAAIADEAGIRPGLVHHYFASKQELQNALLDALVARYRRRFRETDGSKDEGNINYSDATLAVGPRADVDAARAWVAIFAHAQSDPALFRKVRRLLDDEVEAVVKRSERTLNAGDGCAIVSFVVGSLVFGAFAPQKAPGFAAPRLRALMGCLARGA